VVIESAVKLVEHSGGQAFSRDDDHWFEGVCQSAELPEFFTAEICHEWFFAPSRYTEVRTV
jgi:hypothetical protein|tara:strand:- start:376 stop:558 length:183 start_codon:yes stop_codon:yes gene_type:complete